MLRFKGGEGCLFVEFDGKKVLKIDSGSVCVGVGKNTYSMSHGSFKIKEKVSKKKQLKITRVFVSENRAGVVFDDGCLQITVEKNRLKFVPQGLGKYNRLWVRIPATEDEHVYGSGEIFSEFDLRGKKANVWVAEHINALQIAKKLLKQVFGIKNTTKKQKFSNYETYYAQPTFISSRKYFYHSLTTARAEFDFKDKGFHTVKTDEVAPFYIGFGNDFESVLESLTDIVGRQPVLPDWVYGGQILGVQGGTETMLKKYGEAVEYGADVNGIW
ncbi:MAG: hypothetical protein K2M36_04555, partial [Clostridia bacterium]|nr:hypothetical protein [Clostridia bacterium]